MNDALLDVVVVINKNISSLVGWFGKNNVNNMKRMSSLIEIICLDFELFHLFFVFLLVSHRIDGESNH